MHLYIYIYIHSSLPLPLCSIYYYYSCYAIFINIQVIILKSGEPAPPAVNCTHVHLYISFDATANVSSYFN